MAEAESASTRFDRLQKLLQGVATREGCERLQQMLNNVTMTMLYLGPQLNTIEKSLEVNRKSEILQWISNIPYTEHHARISDGHLKGTDDWLFEREEYRNWQAISASKLLLLRGIPGAGKTYIASRVIDSFRKMPEGKLAYFYCNRAEENRREPRKILSTLIQQLAQAGSKEGSKEGLLTPIVDIYRDRERNGQKSAQLSLKESQDLLVQPIDIYPQTTICINAIDEVDDDTRIHLLKSLKNVIKASKNVVKIFVTTRMDSDILMQFEIFPRIELEPDDNKDDSDINAFLRIQVQSLIDDGLLLHGKVSNELKEEIYNSLCQRCKGNFQLAALHLGFLRKMRREKDIKQNLTVLPKTLTLAYDEIYEGILAQEGSAPQMALNAFRWIQCSMEPLSSKTLLDAIMVEIDSSGGFSQTGPATKEQLLTVCQNLIIMDDKLNTFRFAHLSVHEYLDKKLPKVDSHLELSKVCFSLLCSDSAWNAYDHNLETEEEAHHLLFYSAYFWPSHFRQCRDIRLEHYPILSSLWERRQISRSRWRVFSRLISRSISELFRTQVFRFIWRVFSRLIRTRISRSS
ncbi:hypothetical protein L211DRAFT_333519 [Terfezia boudieri ATCC MYA-4762]|uniref:NACHT domain-containing protein n=1 Tax=Terfezia boudieri ATCC MYA-4762 TaxID=1051890 RepID=A0A3N4LLH0_9PEZI|nr:hypothetical protein L211DRAFT_333519 [Terfezia boudieri ATCC MYA-4762]